MPKNHNQLAEMTGIRSNLNGESEIKKSNIKLIPLLNFLNSAILLTGRLKPTLPACRRV